MLDEWFSAMELPLSWQQFWQLPQNPAYKYEYFDGRALLSPRPKTYRAVLDLHAFLKPAGGITAGNQVAIRLLQEPDWQDLPGLFAGPPFTACRIVRSRLARTHCIPASPYVESRCGREDSNLHSLRNQILSLTRLPVSPRPRCRLMNLPRRQTPGKAAHLECGDSSPLCGLWPLSKGRKAARKRG